MYGFAPDIISAGTGYFRRLAAIGFLVNADATADMEIEAMLPQSTIRQVAAVHAYYLQAEAWLTLVHLTCIYLAAKYIDFVPCQNMLQTMMGHIYDMPVIDKSYVTSLELDCLDALKWQLGTDICDGAEAML